jgi:YbbR domain-containing protein
LANISLPVVPVLVGQLATGYRISAITVEPLVVTVSGEAAIVSRLESAPTLAINVAGRTSDLEANVGLDLPPGISVNGTDQIKVTITIVREVPAVTASPGTTPSPAATPVSSP